MKNLWTSLRLLVCMIVILGLAYPLGMTWIAHITSRTKATGSLVSLNNAKVGSALLAQKFETEKYFWPRPSANDYNGLASGGSNLGPTSLLLKKTIEQRKAFLLKAHSLADDVPVPVELLFASGSGLDPHISPSAAHFQVGRIVKARSSDQIDENTLYQLIEKNLEKPWLHFIGSYRVNVLLLNIAIDELDQREK